ncbi:MAG: hypothetical protein AB7Q29_04950 [Vicinamibacterales bacterium]
MRPAITHAATVLCVGLLVWTVHAVEPVRAGSAFAAEVERLSEPEGYFDTDNLVSNEGSYLTVVPELLERGVGGGVYIGVGPDQNFSYIARIRPSTAYIVDIRRDNLLLHLLFKALFAASSTRVEYLSLLTGRAPPGDLGRWRSAGIGEIVAHVDAQSPSADRVEHVRRQLDARIAGFGIPLTTGDFSAIDRFHRAFIGAGLDLKFESFGRRMPSYYPTYRELLLATDGAGREWNYLASEDDFQFLKRLQGIDGIVPVVGNLAGTEAMRRVATTVATRGEKVSAVYISNVETYVVRGGHFEQYVDNLRRLPHDDATVVIRSMFGRGTSRSIVDLLSTRYGPPRAPSP